MKSLPTSRRFHWLIAMTLLIALAGSGQWFFTQRAKARIAMADSAACVRLADRIAALRTRPGMIQTQAIEQTDLVRRIETALRQAGILPASLIRIAHPSPRRIADTSYEERTAQISLHHVTLKQLISALYALSTGKEKLTVKSCRLSAPRDPNDDTTWQAEVTISYLIYSPIVAPSSPKAP